MPPHSGQGAFALETRHPEHSIDCERDTYIRQAVAFLEHPYT